MLLMVCAPRKDHDQSAHRHHVSSLIDPDKKGISLIFSYKRAKTALYCSPDYQINWPFGSGEEVQNRFPR